MFSSRLLRAALLLALPFVLVACDSNDEEPDRACYDRGDAADACFSYTDTVVGTGETPSRTNGDSVFVRYIGRIQGNGNAEFDRGAFGFPLREGEVIPGFLYAIGGGTLEGATPLSIPSMRVGGKRIATIPAELAYGDREIRGQDGYVLIPRNATLVFDIELTGIRRRQTGN